MFLNRLLEETSGKPIEKWQIAVNGVWEEARQIPIQPTAQETENLLEWVKNSPQNLAIESFFKDEENFFFYGLRIEELSKREQVDFVKSILAEASIDMQLPDVLKAVKKALDSPALLEEKPDFLELGTEGFWKSRGSLKVWGQGDSEPKDMAYISKHASQLLEPFTNAVMLEFAWKKPLPMWLGIPVTEYNAKSEEFEFSQNRYDSLTSNV